MRTVTAGAMEAAGATLMGCVPKASFAAAPTVMLNVFDAALVRFRLAAVRVYPVPTLSMDRPLNVATPATAATSIVPESFPPPGFVPIAATTWAVLEVRFPLASWICTVTAGAIVGTAGRVGGLRPERPASTRPLA